MSKPVEMSLKEMLDAAANGPLLRADGHVPLVQRDEAGVVRRGGYELSSLAYAAAIRKRGEG